MTEESVLSARSLLAWTNARLVVVKRLMRHRHDDVAWWAEQHTEARWIQRERETLRQVANLLHVERANTRGRLHGFATLEEQREWLAKMETHKCWRAADYLGISRDSTLVELRAGRVSRERTPSTPVALATPDVPPAEVIVATRDEVIVQERAIEPAIRIEEVQS
jgi:hypothetical protein